MDWKIMKRAGTTKSKASVPTGALHQYDKQSHGRSYSHTDEPLTAEEPLNASLVFIDQLVEGGLEGVVEGRCGLL